MTYILFFLKPHLSFLMAIASFSGLNCTFLDVSSLTMNLERN